ncbi:MAG: tyrosine-type recombinase/integrase, partial [Myxococcota bacterium]
MNKVIQIRKENGFIKVSFPYNPDYVEKIKTIKGHRWHPQEKYWSFSNSDGILEKILKVFEGEKIHIDPNLKSSVIARTENVSEKVEQQSQFKIHPPTSTLNQAINALKFYYGMMLKKRFVYEVKRPGKDKKLPVVLSKEEVAKILNSVDNVKHKAVLMLVYSAGLRVSEVIKLKPEDIDSKRKL